MVGFQDPQWPCYYEPPDGAPLHLLVPPTPDTALMYGNKGRGGDYGNSQWQLPVVVSLEADDTWTGERRLRTDEGLLAIDLFNWTASHSIHYCNFSPDFGCWQKGEN